jgi:hypothetical protein
MNPGGETERALNRLTGPLAAQAERQAKLFQRSNPFQRANPFTIIRKAARPEGTSGQTPSGQTLQDIAAASPAAQNLASTNPPTEAPAEAPTPRADTGGAGEPFQIAQAKPGIAGIKGNSSFWALESAAREIVDSAESVSGDASEAGLGVASGAGRLVGLDNAADNLDHFLEGSGQDRIIPRDEARKRDPVHGTLHSLSSRMQRLRPV